LCWGAKPRYADSGNESSMERKFPGAKVRGNESSIIRFCWTIVKSGSAEGRCTLQNADCGMRKSQEKVYFAEFHLWNVPQITL